MTAIGFLPVASVTEDSMAGEVAKAVAARITNGVCEQDRPPRRVESRPTRVLRERPASAG